MLSIMLLSTPGLFPALRELSVTGYGRRKVGQKGHWEVLEFWSSMWEAQIVLVSLRDAGGFVFERFPPKRRPQIDTN